jgi:hypothetical protein
MTVQYLKPLKENSYLDGQGGYGYDFGPRDARRAVIRNKLQYSEAEGLKYKELAETLSAVVKDF